MSLALRKSSSTFEPQQKYSLLDAFVVFGLVASIHNTDQSVRKAGLRLLSGIKPDYQGIILAVINSPAPLNHVRTYIATLPDRILTMRSQQAKKVG